MTGRLTGKVALITGTGGGQGRAAALLFAREGAVVIGCDLDGDAARATAELADQAGLTVDSSHPVDLTLASEAQAWIDGAVERHGRINILYNNAASTRSVPIAEMNIDDWSFTLRNELDIVFYACRAAWRHLVAAGGGSIVNTASTAGLLGSPATGVGHSAGKGGVLALTRQLAVEGGSHGIRANCVTPGSIASGPARALGEDERFMRSYRPQTPLRRLGTADDIAYAALFLACDESGFITGQSLVVDGGRSATGFVFLEVT